MNKNSTFILAFGLFVLLISCAEKSKKTKPGFFDFKDYFKKQTLQLNQVAPEFQKVVSINGEPNSYNPDTINWNQELAIFQTLEMGAEKVKEKYRIELDSTQRISIQELIALDSQEYITRISITRVSGKIELVEAVLKKRSIVVDRDITISYQPLKGYSIRMIENYIWSKPKTTEIYTEIRTADDLMN